MTPGIVDFLLARIAEDEATARVAAPGPWEYQDVESVGGGRICDPTVEIADLHYEQPGEVDPRIRRSVLSDEADGTGWHIARWDPTRVLAECEAKRAIIRLHESWPVLVEAPVEFDPPDTTITGLTMRVTRRMAWLTQQEYRARFGSEPPTTPMLRALALPYADHPDYREEWKP